MKRFRIEFTDEAKADIARSYDWGKREWGASAATKCYRALRTSVRDLLGHFPLSQSIAPESNELGEELRQLVFQRYRLIFEIHGKTVRVVHLKGLFVDEDPDPEGEINERTRKTTSNRDP